MSLLKVVIGILLLAGLSGCDDGITKITDYYYLYETVDFDYDGNSIEGRNVFVALENNERRLTERKNLPPPAI